eukprot:34552-Eustigmatos_ZCMA.PRE.1
MLSSAGEVVLLSRPVAVTDRVEVWLDELTEEMRSTLSQRLVLCLSESIKFTATVESALHAGK